MTSLPHTHPEAPDTSDTVYGRPLSALMLIAGLSLGGVITQAMPSAPAGTVETGAPSFVVLGPEALGLSTAPLDLYLLPDGRILVVSQHELAFGDGVRWETYRGAEDQSAIFAMVAVDGDGQIYTGISGGIARIDLGEDARWRFTPVTKLPGDASMQSSTMTSVATLPDRWYWYGSNDAIVSWQPGQTARLAGKVGAIDRIYALGENVYLSDQSSGKLFRLKPDRTAEPVLAADILVSESVTCAIPFGPVQLLAGTVSAGLKLFDGKTFRSFGPPGLLRNGHRITDLCQTGEGLFAAAVDTVGIVFFDREGRTVQVLERSLDHRLARVQCLRYARDGVLWALLNDGVARVEFPSPVSHYEPLLASGLAYALPMRHAGQLWVLADGRAMHGIYDASGRLNRFEDETPPGRYLFTLNEVAGQLFASNDEGIYVYEKTGWRMILSGIVNARIGVARSTSDGIFYVARGEYGMIQQTGQSYTARRIPAPDLGDSYNAEVDATGIGWIELGVSRVGRLDPHDDNPSLQILGTHDGLADGWVELYLFDGIARFHLGSHLFRFDEVRRKFVEDRELLTRIPQLATAGGRPVTDSLGRLWFTADGTANAIDRSAAGGNRPVKIAPVGFAPTGYTAEDDGVVWMFVKRWLARMDLRFPSPPRVPLRALITSVQFSASNRRLFIPGAALMPLKYADNSLIIHFVAPANPFALPITFEVLLEGAGTQWVSTGAVGSASFNHLKEGDYVFRVRPVAGGVTPGAEARLQFTVQPPWFRTPLAWAIYIVATAGLLAFVTWLSSHLQHRENARLELLVGKRTGELNATNAQLGRQIEETTEKSAALSVSEERFRLLNAELENRVQKRTDELARSLSLLNATIESVTDGIVVVNLSGKIIHYNTRFAAIWQFPANLLELRDSEKARAYSATLLKDPERFLGEITEHNGGKAGRGFDVVELKDGRIFERYVFPQRIGDERVGNVINWRDVTARNRAEAELARLHLQLLETSRQAGMAEVATSVLHNVGNVLNSVNVSATLVADHVRHTQANNIAKVAAIFEEHKADLAGFLTKDARGQMIPAYLGSLAEILAAEQQTLIAELDHLCKNVEHIKDIVAMQQAYAGSSGVTETVSVPDLIEDALRIDAGSLARHAIDTIRDYQARPVVTTDKHKVMQILINLIRNAKYACDESGRTDKQITVRTTSDVRRVHIAVIDNGVGILAENLNRIFNHGFTTRKTGHGFGLHSGALAARELGGSLTVQSDGPGHGATFTLDLPCKSTTPTHENFLS